MLVYNVYIEEQDDIHQQAQTLAKSMNLSVVRLCFQAFLPDENGRYTIPIDPVFSNKVYDSSKSLMFLKDSVEDVIFASFFNNFVFVNF